jgi:hypothetical protein
MTQQCTSVCTNRRIGKIVCKVPGRVRGGGGAGRAEGGISSFGIMLGWGCEAEWMHEEG